MDTWAEHVRLLVGLMAIVDPVGAIPVFLTATEGQNEHQLKATCKVAAITVALTLLIAAWAGDYLLYMFGISMPAFQVGGGILVMLMAISMLHAYPSGATHRPEEDEEARVKDDVGVVPLGIPLMAGPGALALVIMDKNLDHNIAHSAYLSLSILFLALLVWVVFRVASPLGKRLGKTGINISTRLMGLLLAAIAVELIASGMRSLFPILG
jgi:multiple antibiotic resistance protein